MQYGSAKIVVYLKCKTFNSIPGLCDEALYPLVWRCCILSCWPRNLQWHRKGTRLYRYAETETQCTQTHTHKQMPVGLSQTLSHWVRLRQQPNICYKFGPKKKNLFSKLKHTCTRWLCFGVLVCTVLTLYTAIVIYGLTEYMQRATRQNIEGWL